MIPVLLFLAYVIFSFYKHGGLVLPKISWFTGKEKAAIVVQDTLQNMSPIVTDTISNDTLRSLEHDTVTPTTVSTSVEPEKSLETKPKDDTNSKENNKPSDEHVAIVKSAPIPSYIVVGGSFKSEKNAREYVKKLRAKGYANASVQGKNELGEYIVAFNIYKNRNEAVESLTNIKNNIQPSAWIMTR
jgi:cell division protein FtsN